MKKLVLIIFIGIFVVIAVIGGLSFFNKKSIAEEDNSYSAYQEEKQVQEHEKSSQNFQDSQNSKKIESAIPSCGDKKILFTTLHLSIDDFTHIIPLGNLAPSAHVFPTPHVYFWIKKVNPNEPDGVPVEVSVYAPADVTITEMSSTESKKRPNAKDYKITFSPCKEAKFYFVHLRSVSEKIKSAFESTPTEFCNQYTLTYTDTEGAVDWNYCVKKVNIKIKEGEKIGTAGGGLDQRAFDFGAVDYCIKPHAYANPDRWKQQPDAFYVTCPFDYFSSELQSKLKAKLGKGPEASNKRTIEPICGTIEQDIIGTAQGSWFPKGHEGIGPENPFIALVHDNLNPNQPVFSIGLSVKTLPRGLYYFNPKSSGAINRDFSEITPSQIYCYDTLWVDFVDRKKEGIILVQLLDEKTLTIEWQNKAGCFIPYAFTNEASVFER